MNLMTLREVRSSNEVLVESVGEKRKADEAELRDPTPPPPKRIKLAGGRLTNHRMRLIFDEVH